MAIGMSYEQFWHGDPVLCKWYRKAENLRIQKQNEAMWLQGMYIYEAILDASPILGMNAKAGAKPTPYPSEPYAITKEDQRRKEEAHEKRIAEETRRRIESMMKRGDGNGGKRTD